MEISEASGPIKVAALLVAAEAMALLCLAVVVMISLDSDRLSLGISSAAFYLLAAGGLAFAAWGFVTVQRWSRGPVVLAQFIQLGVAYSFVGGATTWVSVVLALIAIAVLLVVFAPSTTTALYGYRDEPTTQSDDDVKG